MNNGNAYHITKPRKPTAPIQEIYALICARPGISTTELNRRFSGIQNRLASLEAQGLLVSEDQYGCLYPFILEPL